MMDHNQHTSNRTHVDDIHVHPLKHCVMGGPDAQDTLNRLILSVKFGTVDDLLVIIMVSYD